MDIKRVWATLLLTTGIFTGSSVYYTNEIKKLEEEKELKDSEIAKLEGNLKRNDKYIKDVDSKLNESLKKNEELKLENESLKANNEELKNENEKLKRKANFNQSQKVGDVQGGKILTMNASAYIVNCREGCTGKTASGYNVNNTIYYNGMRIIASDTNVLPMYSVVEIEGFSERFIVLDRGGAIKGNKIDILMSSTSEAMKFGRKNVKVRVIRYGR